MNHMVVRALLLIAAASMVGCTAIKAGHERMDPVSLVDSTVEQDESAPSRGTIYSSNAKMNLFEDQRPSRMGDQVIVVINERTNAQKSSRSTSSRDAQMSAKLPTITNLPGGLGALLGLSIGADAKASNKQTGGGDTQQNNNFTGTVTASIVKVLKNGNYLIKGKKQIAINGDLETLTIEGVVSPSNISQSSMVSSLNISEARIAYSGQGDISDAQKMGLINRLFMSLAPL